MCLEFVAHYDPTRLESVLDAIASVAKKCDFDAAENCLQRFRRKQDYKILKV